MEDSFSAIGLIQQALTPVFLIVGIGTLLNSLTQRLARIVDRVRWLDSPEADEITKYKYGTKKEIELKALSRRMRWANWAINFLCGAALMVCFNIVLLVINGYFSLQLDDWIIISFTSTLIFLSFGTISLFIEVSLATASLRVASVKKNPKDRPPNAP